MEIKTLAKNTSMLAIPKVVKFFVGIFRAKLVAIFLGTLGAGILAQLRTILQSISTFTSAGMSDGMVKQLAIANAKNQPKEEIASIIKTYAVPISVLTVIVYFLGYIFGKEITIYVFGDLEYYNYFLIGFSALPLMILSGASFALLKSYKKIKLIMYSEIAIIVINLVVFFILIYFFGLTGAVFYVTFSYLSIFLLYNYFARSRILKKLGISFRDILYAKFNKTHFKELMTFVGASFTAGVYSIIVEVTTRSIIVNTLGVDKIGVYSPIIAWAALFTGFIIPSLSTYLFPRLSEAKNDKDIIMVVNDVFRLMTFAALPFVTVAIVMRQYMIPLFYSQDFMEAAIYLPFHFVGLFLAIWDYCFVQIYAPTGRIKYVVIFSIIGNTIVLAIVYYLVPLFGLWGWTARFVVGYLFSLIVDYIFFHYAIGFRFKKENLMLLFFVVIFSTLLLVFRNVLIVSSVIGIIGMIATWKLLRKEEQRFLLNKLKIGIKDRKK